MHLKDKILNKEKGLILYGLTPPKAEFNKAKLFEISNRWTKRINSVDIDGIVLYNVQDESERAEDRTYEFSENLDPEIYYNEYLNVTTPSIFYKAVSYYNEDSFKSTLIRQNGCLNVLVGASSSTQNINLSLQTACKIAGEFENLTFGCVCIAERHALKGNEHQRMLEKMKIGAKFFISQAIFDINSARRFLIDCAKAKICVPIFLSFSTIGDLKGVEFIKWLGVNVPNEIENRLNSSSDFLAKSCEIITEIWQELKEFGDQNGLNLSINIESVVAKKAEIQASLELVKKLKML